VELLPLDYDGLRFWVINVLEVSDCLDLPNCVYPADRPWAIEEYAFLPDRFGQSLFKLPQHRMAAPYVVEDAERPESSFKTAVERNRLRGIGFKQVWEGPCDTQGGDRDCFPRNLELARRDTPSQPFLGDPGSLPTPLHAVVREAEADHVLLEWQYARGGEQVFFIEWSRDGSKFVAIDDVSATPQPQTSPQGLHVFQYLDKLPTSGTRQYRIKAFDAKTGAESGPSVPVSVTIAGPAKGDP
jgi:hypothetical protein